MTLKERRLVINKGEADQVREIFRLYLEIGCVRQLKHQLDTSGIASKVRISRTGRKSGGAAYSRGALYKILNNRIYLGEIPHKENSYAGEHAAIIDPRLWEQVHAKLAENAHARRHGTNASAPSLLRGLLFDEQGNRFTPSHAVKDGRRYRYHVSQHVMKGGSGGSDEPHRIPARDIENPLVVSLCNSFSGLGILRLGLPVDWNIGIGVLPQIQESFVRLPRGGFISHHLLRAAKLEPRQRPDDMPQGKATIIDHLLELSRGRPAIAELQISETTDVGGVNKVERLRPGQIVPGSPA
jgi:hypothetical protein